MSDDIKKLDLPTLEALDKLTDSWGDDDTITSDILMQFKDYAKDFFDYEKWAEDHFRFDEKDVNCIGIEKLYTF